MNNSPTRRVIDLNPYDVKDETLAALEAEIHEQSDLDARDTEIGTVTTIVLDSDGDGLDSHAVIFTQPTNE